MSYHDWHVGMKVVCVDDVFDESGRNGIGRACEVVPVAGQVYTIRAIGKFYPGNPEELVIVLNEIVNPVLPYRYGYSVVRSERCFGVFRFRPVQKRKTDISIFTAILHDQRDKVEA